jgi:arylsulfatase A-like enzyme
VLDSLEAHGVADNTIVMFASDNGCAHYIGAKELEAQGHFPSAHLRGYKSDAWDGGHRIPFVVRWPGVTKPGSTCAHTVCLSDLMATSSDILGQQLPEDAGEDSVSIAPLLRGEDRAVREHVVHHSISGKFAFRSGKWKLVLCAGSGGWTSPNDDEAVEQGLPAVQLYDMDADPGEKNNLRADHPDIVRELVATLEQLVAEGRSTPGAPQSNDVPVDIWKGTSKTEVCDA